MEADIIPNAFRCSLYGVGIESLITLNPIAGYAYAIKNNRDALQHILQSQLSQQPKQSQFKARHGECQDLNLLFDCFYIIQSVLISTRSLI
jgi:hypothetical protein